MLHHMEVVTVVLYKVQRFRRVRVTAREDKVGYFALTSEEKKFLTMLIFQD